MTLCRNSFLFSDFRSDCPSLAMGHSFYRSDEEKDEERENHFHSLINLIYGRIGDGECVERERKLREHEKYFRFFFSSWFHDETTNYDT